MSNKRITPFQMELLYRARLGMTPLNGRETNAVEKLEERGLVTYSPGYGPSFYLSLDGRAFLNCNLSKEKTPLRGRG